jgi:hypothetical protein
MTYQNLKEKLNKLSPEQLNQDVTIYLSGIVEFHVVDKIVITKEDDVLDRNHVVLVTHEGNTECDMENFTPLI